MRVIAKKTLVEYEKSYPDVKGQLVAWYKFVEKEKWLNLGPLFCAENNISHGTGVILVSPVFTINLFGYLQFSLLLDDSSFSISSISRFASFSPRSSRK